MYHNIFNSSNTVCSILDKYQNGKFLLIFDHGLGDMVLFLNIFNELQKKYSYLDLYIGCCKKSQLKCLHEKIFEIPYKTNETIKQNKFWIKKFHERYDINPLNGQFKEIMEIKFHEDKQHKKLLLCNKKEIGLDENLINSDISYKIPYDTTKETISKKVVIHLVSNTSPHTKGLNQQDAHNLYKCLINHNFDVTLLHSSFDLSNDAYMNIKFDFIPEDKIYRENNNLSNMVNIISTANYFFGVASGPLCIAHNILGDNKCIFLKKVNPGIEHYILNTKMKTINDYSLENINRIIENLISNNN